METENRKMQITFNNFINHLKVLVNDFKKEKRRIHDNF